MIKNLASRWSKAETEVLISNIDSEDYEGLCELLPGRSKASIKAKQKRLLKANEDAIEPNIAKGIFKYYLDGESEGQILQRLKATGYSYPLADIAYSIKEYRKAFTREFTAYAEERGLVPKFKYPTIDQLRLFIELSKIGDEVTLKKVITNG